MTATLLELAVGIVLIVAAWQIGTAVAPSVITWLRAQSSAPDDPTDDIDSQDDSAQKEHVNGTR